jgi:hypothetical protein
VMRCSWLWLVVSSEWLGPKPGQPRFGLCVGTIFGVALLQGYLFRRWLASRTARPRRDGRCEKTCWRGCLELVDRSGAGTTCDGLLALGSVAAVSG